MKPREKMMAKKKMTAHFIVTGEALTNIPRQLWLEGRPEAALRILEAAFPGMPPDMRVAVAMGYKKLEGDSDVGITVVDDTEGAEPAKVLEKLLEPYKKEIDKLADAAQFATDDVVSISSPYGLIQVPKRRTVLKTIKGQRRRVLDGGWGLLECIPWKEVFPPDRAQEFFHPRTELEREELLEAPEPPPPPPSPVGKTSIDADNGWLSPEGKFYSCRYGGHITLADRLGYDSIAIEEAGWIKILEGDAWSLRSLSGKLETTQRQLDLLFDWYLSRGRELPYWMEPDKED